MQVPETTESAVLNFKRIPEAQAMAFFHYVLSTCQVIYSCLSFLLSWIFTRTKSRNFGEIHPISVALPDQLPLFNSFGERTNSRERQYHRVRSFDVWSMFTFIKRVIASTIHDTTLQQIHNTTLLCIARGLISPSIPPFVGFFLTDTFTICLF